LVANFGGGGGKTLEETVERSSERNARTSAEFPRQGRDREDIGAFSPDSFFISLAEFNLERVQLHLPSRLTGRRRQGAKPRKITGKMARVPCDGRDWIWSSAN